MPGGYLRVLYPAPEACLDLKSWQEFYGFDQKGQEGWFDIEVDTEQLIMRCRESGRIPQAFLRMHGEDGYLKEIREVIPGNTSAEVLTDFTGKVTGDKRIAGPMAEWKRDVWYSIDPRKNKTKGDDHEIIY